MGIPLLTWSDNTPGHVCRYDTCQEVKARSIEEVHVEAKKGCCRCVLIHLSCSRYLASDCDLEIIVVKQDDNLFWLCITERASGYNRDCITIQLYYTVRTPQPAWNLVKPGRLSTSGRRESYKALLDEWIQGCDSTHKECVVKDAELPHRVLDVGDESNNYHICLHISDHRVAPYVALSHCWGKHDVPKTNTDTIADHTNMISFESLPKNFQDAITITRSIGIRYLWIDSLCIVQDNRKDWEIESAKMASVYNNAYLVLAASQATDSLDGFLDRKDAEFENALQLNPKNSHKIANLKNPDSSISEIYSRVMSTDPTNGKSQHRWKVSSSPLNQRGWVLQECILARRIVHFTDSEMIWECVECLRCECMEVEAHEKEATSWSELSMVRDLRMEALHGDDYAESQRINHLYLQWRKLISLYGRLILTEDTDRLPALSGLAKHCQSRGLGKYLAGIWENDLLVSLVWHIRTDEPVQAWSEYMAPSWSPFSVGYIERCDGLIEAGYWYCEDERYHQRWAEPQAEVLEAQCTPTGNDPTGTVKDGFLILRGPMRKDDLDRPSHSWVGWDPEDPSNHWKWSVWSDISWDQPSEQPERSKIVFFLLWADFGMGYIKALCLLPSETVPDTYRRVGVVDSHFKNKWLGDFFRDTVKGVVRIE